MSCFSTLKNTYNALTLVATMLSTITQRVDEGQAVEAVLIQEFSVAVKARMDCMWLAEDEHEQNRPHSFPQRGRGSS